MMQKILLLKVALMLSLFLNVQYLSGQQNDSIASDSIYQDLSNHQTNRVAKNNECRNSLEIGPDYDLDFIQFCRKFSSRDESILAVSYEIRLGYLFNFDIFDVPFYVNCQWFCGYYLYNPKPQSFVEVDGGSFYISPVPMFLIGIKF